MKLIDILVEELPKSGGWLSDVKTMTQDRGGNIWGYDCVSPCLKGGLWSSKSGDDLVRNSKIEARNLAVDWNTAIITREQYEAALAAKNEGWIDWVGGECPVSDSTIVEVRYRNGEVKAAAQADFYEWGHGRPHFVTTGRDIIAYRLHQPQEAEQTEADDEADLNECIGHDAVQVWSGEGLPPVGCECEFMKHNRDIHADAWRKGVIKYISEFTTVISAVDVPGEFIAHPATLQFRPIRSEAERKRHDAAQALCYAGGGIGKVDESAGIGSCWFDVYDAIAAGKIPGVKLED